MNMYHCCKVLLLIFSIKELNLKLLIYYTEEFLVRYLSIITVDSDINEIITKRTRPVLDELRKITIGIS
mgnify:CR=1 FL=1